MIVQLISEDIIASALPWSTRSAIYDSAVRGKRYRKLNMTAGVSWPSTSTGLKSQVSVVSGGGRYKTAMIGPSRLMSSDAVSSTTASAVWLPVDSVFAGSVASAPFSDSDTAGLCCEASVDATSPSTPSVPSLPFSLILFPIFFPTTAFSNPSSTSHQNKNFLGNPSNLFQLSSVKVPSIHSVIPSLQTNFFLTTGDVFSGTKFFHL